MIRPRGAVVLGVVLVCAGCLLFGASTGELDVRAAAPIALVAVDAADWQAIDPLIAAGRLPTFAALKSGGAVGTMRADPPLLSPIIWTTVATGRRPEDHGVLDFMIDLPNGGQAPVSGAARRTKALWEIFSDAGRPVLVAGWWATWPPDSVRGAIVTDRLIVPHIRFDERGADDAALVHPANRTSDVLTARVRPGAIDYRMLNDFVPLTRAEFDEAVRSDRGPDGELYRNRFAHARAALAAARTYGAATIKLLSIRPAFIAVYFELVDTVSHLFIADERRGNVAISSAYVEVDRQIRDVARALDPDTLVIVMSDHGFYPATAGIADNPADLTSGAAAWHRPYGIVAAVNAGTLAGTRAAVRMPALGALSPLDVAPTLLARAGLPVASDMPGHVAAALAGARPVTKIASYGLHRVAEPPREAASAAAALARLRALGYVSGTAPVTWRARVNLGEILFRKGNFKDAIRELEAALRGNPHDQRAALWLARAYASSDRPDDAARVYDALVQQAIDGSQVDPLIVLAATDLDVGRGRVTQAVERLTRLPASLRRQPDTLVAQAAAANAERKPSDAERWLRDALTLQPTNIEALSRLVDLLLRSGRTADAAQIAAQAARRFPDSAERHALVGETSLAEHRPADAARAFRDALALVPDAASVRLELARAELLQNRPDAALRALGDLTRRDGEIIRGAAYSQQHDWARAIAAYTRAAADGRPSVELLNALGNAQLEAGRPADAAATLERSLAIKADQPAIRELAARARRSAERTKS
jgi:tetratricopeptide (TPR) repeat protein